MAFVKVWNFSHDMVCLDASNLAQNYFGLWIDVIKLLLIRLLVIG